MKWDTNQISLEYKNKIHTYIDRYKKEFMKIIHPYKGSYGVKAIREKVDGEEVRRLLKQYYK